MALQSNGPIKLSEIKSELGSSSNSLRALSGLASLGIPDAISEFYGYSSYSNSKYYHNDGVNDYAQITGGAGTNAIGSGALTISFWVRQNSSVNKNAQIINIAPGFDKNNRLMIDYNTSNNKLRLNHRESATNTFREYHLGANPNANTGGAWTSNSRGNTNAQGWTMLTFVYDGRQGALEGLNVYWNTSQLDHQVETAGSRGDLTMSNMRLGENIHNVGTAGNANIDLDEIKIYNRLLSVGEIASLYNGGTIVNASTAGVDAGIIAEVSFDTGTFVDSAGHFSSTGTLHNGGAIQNH